MRFGILTRYGTGEAWLTDRRGRVRTFSSAQGATAVLLVLPTTMRGTARIAQREGVTR